MINNILLILFSQFEILTANTQYSNFDLNIVFTPQNFKDYMKLYHKQEKNPYILQNKNRYL